MKSVFSLPSLMEENMKSVLRGLCCVGLLACFAWSASAATMTMTGTISDSMCGMSHAKMIAGHAGMTDKACTMACVKAGAKYVFVANKKVYTIENQDLTGLQEHAGERVTLTADFGANNVITVSKVAMVAKAKPKA
jgi:hypothetical protein